MRRLILVGTTITLCAATNLPSPQAIRASRAGCPEDPRLTLGAFGRLSALDTDLPVNTGIGGGWRIGLRLFNDWYGEGDLSINKDFEDGPELRFTPIHLRLVRQWHDGETTRYRLGLGYLHTSYEGGAGDDLREDDPLHFDGTDNGVTGSVGFERDIGQLAALRVDAVLDANLDGTLAADGNPDWHLGLEVGFNFGFGAGRRVDGDEDRDLILDSKDLCPGTPLGTTVDGDGCPILIPEGSVTVVLDGVNFEVDTEHLLPESRAVLDRVAASLVAHPATAVEIRGFTDNTGDPVRNRELATARANTVRAYLIAKGANPDRLTAVGIGPDNPIDTNETEAGRARNRRVELKRTG
ncbi:MAG TPA: OmpA family protein [Candidatus Eisenbacteria bacterium]